MASYSRVTDKDKYYKVVASPKKPNEVVEAKGFYVGGTVQTGVKFKNRQFTAHLLLPDRSVVGINFTPGFTKQFLNGQSNLAELLGKYVSIRAGKVVPTKMGDFTEIICSELPAPFELPSEAALGFKLTHFVDIDKIKAGQGLNKRPVAANDDAEDYDDAGGEEDSTSNNQALSEAAASIPSGNANPFA